MLKKGYLLQGGMKRMLYKSSNNKIICGVCAGLAEYFNIDLTVVRLTAALLSLIFLGTCDVVYIIVALIIPEG